MTIVSVPSNLHYPQITGLLFLIELLMDSCMHGIGMVAEHNNQTECILKQYVGNLFPGVR